ncbi:MAG: hypothetical protein F4Z02_13910 [Acidimicrobiia bacterium]|nr:hypothetical protein [Acidimicrobiia bacterium]MYG71854.1 hypothetical protein [Acidimicrobiia bacterium]
MGLIVLASPAFWPANAAAQEEGTAIEVPTPAFELVSQSMWIADEDVFRVSLRLLDAPEEATVDINIGLPIRSRSAFLDRLAEPSTGLGPQQMIRLPISAPDANGITSLQIATTSSQESEIDTLGQPTLNLSVEGVYPVSLVLRDTDGSRLDTIHTFLVRTPPSDPNQPPLLVSTVLSVSGPPAVSPEGNVDLGPAFRSLQTLADVFDPRIRPQPLAAVSVDPHLVDALAISEQPEHTMLLARLQQATTNRQITSNTYVPLDSDAWIDQDLSLQIGWQIEAGAAVLDGFLGSQTDRTTMVLTTSASPELLQRLQRERVELVLVSDALLDPANELVSTSAKTSFLLPAFDEPMEAAAIDSTVTAHFARSDITDTAPYLVLADLAVRWFEDPQQLRGIVMAPPLDSLPDSTGLGILLDEISASPILSSVDSAAIVESLEPEVLRRVRPAEENGFGEDYKAALSDGQRIARSYQNMVDPIATVDTPERQLIETLDRALLLSGAYGLTETQRDAYLAVVAQTVRDTVAAIQPPIRQRITLTSRSESIPMLIRNSLDHDVIVRLDLKSDKLDFPDGDSLLWRLSPGVNQVQVPVQAKTSGDAVLEIKINSPTGLLALGESQLTVRATSLSGTGVGIAAAALAILMLWWARNWWSRHRSKAEPPKSSVAP